MAKRVGKNIIDGLLLPYSVSNCITDSGKICIEVEDITKEYDLELNSVGCCIMHEETVGSSVPSYFGECVYLMIQKNMD